MEHAILKAANKHVGQKESDNEDPIITAQRESFIWGAKYMLNHLWKSKPPKSNGLYITINKSGCVGRCSYDKKIGWYDEFFGELQKINDIKLWTEIPDA